MTLESRTEKHILCRVAAVANILFLLCRAVLASAICGVMLGTIVCFFGFGIDSPSDSAYLALSWGGLFGVIVGLVFGPPLLLILGRAQFWRNVSWLFVGTLGLGGISAFLSDAPPLWAMMSVLGFVVTFAILLDRSYRRTPVNPDSKLSGREE